MRNGAFPAISINKAVAVLRDSSPPGHSGRRIPAISSHEAAAIPYGEPHGSLGCEKHSTPRQPRCTGKE